MLWHAHNALLPRQQTDTTGVLMFHTHKGLNYSSSSSSTVSQCYCCAGTAAMVDAAAAQRLLAACAGLLQVKASHQQRSTSVLGTALCGSWAGRAAVQAPSLEGLCAAFESAGWMKGASLGCSMQWALWSWGCRAICRENCLVLGFGHCQNPSWAECRPRLAL